MSTSVTAVDPPSGRYRSRPAPQLTPDRGIAGPAPRSWYEPVKALVDVVLGVVLLVVFLPVILIAAAAVRLTSAGPAFYSQLRVGKGGRAFRIYKLRTMFHDCERASGVKWSAPGDPRITPLGTVLRKTHIDELPQLVNVLRLEMSLVGPRPERPEIIPVLDQEIPNYRARLRVRPGVTGLAQVRLPADTTIQSVRRKLAYDLYYIQTRGPWLDVRLMLCTGLKMVGLSLGRTLWALRVPGDGAVGVSDDGPAADPPTATPHARVDDRAIGSCGARGLSPAVGTHDRPQRTRQ